MKQIAVFLFLGILISFSQNIIGQDTGSSPAMNAKSTESSPIESITEAEMRDHIYFLASDYMGGRIATSSEYEIAAQYVATQFASGGVEPLLSEKENMKGYFQEVPFEKVTYSSECKWILNSKKDKTEFSHIDDFKILEGRNLDNGSLDIVFAGYGISEPDHGWNDFEDIDVKGKMVILMSGAPMKKDKPVLPEEIHQQYASMPGLMKKAFPLIERQPAAIVLMLDSETTAMMPYDMIPSNFKEVMYRYMGSKEDAKEFNIPMIYLVKDEVLEAMFEGQNYDPSTIVKNGLKKYKTYQLEDVSLETEVSISERSELSFKNVVGIVKGTDPELSNEYIVVGAHLDHVASGSGEVANGADDDASGSAGVIEIAEAVAMNPPRRSVIFIAYTAEEMGLHGSHYFVNSGPLAIDDIKFNVTLDMIGRTEEQHKDTRSHYVVANTTFMPLLEPFISKINDETIQYPLIFDSSSSHSGSSDHASFHDAGIPAFFFFSGMHEDLHTPGDDPEKIEYDKAVKISQLAYLITMKAANMDKVPSLVE